MDSIATVLEKMDGAAFEILCAQVLPKMVPEFANFIPTGINPAGRTIKSLSDGFCFIAHNHLALVHMTTNSSDLKTKWLYDGNARTMVKGDLVKGIEQAREIYHSHPKYRFTICLIHNRRVDDNLHFEISHRNNDDFIDVKIIEQRNLVSFLDHHPEGQYLRQYFFKIDAIRLSSSLLRDIVKTNLVRYRQEIHLEEAKLAKISAQRKIEEQLTSSSTTVNLMTGESGFGKSTICYSMMRVTLENNEIAIRIKPSVIEKAVSLEDALQQQLILDYPKIYIHTDDLQALFQRALIVIDDINKTENTTAILDKIISWSQLKNDGAPIVLCPVWPQNLAALNNKAKKQRITTITFGRLSFFDCKSIIRQAMNLGLQELTEQQVHSLITGTGYDPLSIDFSLQLLANTNNYSENIPSEAINNYVFDKVQQIHTMYRYPVHLINHSLVLMSREMLKGRKLTPHLTDIEKWLVRGSDEYRIITMFAAQRQLFLFDDVGNCLFRHDRVRDYFLNLGAVTLFSDFTANEDVLADPYYAEMVGAALASITIETKVLETLILSNPLAVFFSLKFLQDVTVEHRRKQMIEVIRPWSKSIVENRIPKSITDAIANALIGFDLQEIESVTLGFPDSAELQLAKFRNGVWLSGVKVFSFFDYFFPEHPTYWWDSILAHVKIKYLSSTIESLRLFLRDKFTEVGIPHAYTLVGFLKEPQLLGPLNDSWKKYASPQHYVTYLWAVLNSFTANDQKLVIGALSYWSGISEDDRRRPIGKGLGAKRAEEQIKYINWEFSEDQLNLLLELRIYADLKEILAMLFIGIDHPIAFSIVLDEEMKRDQTSPWYDDWDDRWDQSKTLLNLSEPSLNYLLQEFSVHTQHPMRRYIAWRYWTGSAEVGVVLKRLQEISDEEDSLFENAVLWRVSHHDETSVDHVKLCIDRKPWLVRVLVDIWNEEVKLFFSDWFKECIRQRNEKHISYGLELLVLLDNEDACHILNIHWEQLKWHQKAIETALFLSTQVTISLADQEIRRLGFEPGIPMHDFYQGNIRGTYFSDEDDLSKEQKEDLLFLAEQFKYLYLHYDTKFKGQGERLTRKKLETLLPYLPLLDSLSIYQFAIASLRIGAPDLCYDKFYPHLQGSLRTRIRFTTEDLKMDIIRKLQELERDNKVYISHWIDEVERIGVTKEMLTEALQSFAGKYKSANAFFIIALILERLGTRKDIDIMDGFLLDFEKERKQVSYWKANAVFLIKRRSLY